MSNELSKFDQSLKNSLEGFEMPYDSGSWNAMSAKLDASGSSSSTNYLLAALVAAGLLISSGVYVYYYVQNAAYEAQVVENTMKIERGTSYLGIAEKSSDKSSTYILGDSESEITNQAALGKANDASTNQYSSETNNNRSSADSNHLADASSNTNQSNSVQNSVTNSGTPNSDVSETMTELADDSETSMEDESSTSGANSLAFAPSVSEACVGVEVTFELTTGDIDGNYLWNFGDGNFSNAPNPTHKYAKSGSYDISLSVTSKNDGKIRSTTMKEMILINPKPKADFEWEFVNNPDAEPTVSFLNTSDSATDCQWVFDETDTTTEINPVTSYDDQGRHAVRLIAQNEFGCIDDKYAYISIDSDYNLLAQESMTPGIEGPNGVFMPLGLKKKDVDFKLTVYNEKQPIFETTNKFKPWDGKLPDGSTAEQGAYPWVVIIYNRYGEEEKYYSGTITITP